MGLGGVNIAVALEANAGGIIEYAKLKVKSTIVETILADLLPQNGEDELIGQFISFLIIFYC
jgi:hypothetical protein